MKQKNSTKHILLLSVPFVESGFQISYAYYHPEKIDGIPKMSPFVTFFASLAAVNEPWLLI